MAGKAEEKGITAAAVRNQTDVSPPGGPVSPKLAAAGPQDAGAQIDRIARGGGAVRLALDRAGQLGDPIDRGPPRRLPGPGLVKQP